MGGRLLHGPAPLHLLSGEAHPPVLATGLGLGLGLGLLLLDRGKQVGKGEVGTQGEEVRGGRTGIIHLLVWTGEGRRLLSAGGCLGRREGMPGLGWKVCTLVRVTY